MTDSPDHRPTVRDPIDPQRALFRFLSKSARKGEPADAKAAATRAGVGAEELPAIAARMQARIAASYPEAPRLADLLGAPNPDALTAIGGYDWVQVGIYTFGLPPTKTRSGTPESAAHRALKEWAAVHPEQVGAWRGTDPTTERWFASGDECDVAFLAPDAATIVEVRPADTEEHELRRALFALVKLRAVLAAEDALAGRSRPITAVLVTTAPAPRELRTLAAELTINIRQASVRS